MSWFYLCIATIFEMGWPLGLKLAYITPHKVMWIIVTIIATSLSGVFLFLAQKEIPKEDFMDKLEDYINSRVIKLKRARDEYLYGYF